MCFFPSLATYYLGLGREHGDARQRGRSQYAQGHEETRSEEIGRHDDHRDGHAPVDAQAVLKALHDAIELRSDGDRHAETQWTDDIVEDPKAGVHREESLPLTRCQRRKTRLFVVCFVFSRLSHQGRA